MKRFAICLLFLFLVPFFANAETLYKVVIKKTGKVIEGKLVSDTPDSIQIISNGLQVTLKKELLDLDKMKELNSVKEKELHLTVKGKDYWQGFCKFFESEL